MSPVEPRFGLREVEPYEAPQLDVPVRLNTNESPHTLPKDFRDDLAETIRGIPLNRYPDREAIRLREALAKHAQHPVEGTGVANGSNEIIQQLLLAYGGPGRRVLVFEPTYALHSRIAWATSSELVRLRLAGYPFAPFVVSSEDVAAAQGARPDVIFVCSPNNPTGNAQDVSGSVRSLAAVGEALVIVDEAYIEFGGLSALPLLETHPNVVVVRTFSKAFALAGARIGYCLATPEVIDDLRRVRLPYHLSALAQAAGLVALRHASEAMAILVAIRKERDRILATLGGMPDVEVFPSQANFILFRPTRPAADVWRALLDRGILVRDVSDAVPGCLRVTAGTPHEVDAFLEGLREVTT